MPLKVIINGALGRMGQTLIKLAPEENAEVVAGVDADDNIDDFLPEAEVIIDFSFHTATPNLVAKAAAAKRPVVIGTTGHTGDERRRVLQHQKDIPLVWAGNYSVGVNLLFFLTQKAGGALGQAYHPEITEIHHCHKKDAPSGTALNLAEALQETEAFADYRLQHGRSGDTGERPRDEIGMHALRGGEVIGEHTVFFFGKHDRIELTHRASDRRIFASGAFRAAHWATRQAPGLYNMQNVLNLA